MTDIKPSVLIVSNCTKEPKFLLELIAKSSDIQQDGSHKFSYSWTIDTKYYTANVDLFAITDHYERDEDFNESVKALIIHTDCGIETGLTSLDKWEGIESDCDLEIKLLVADCCDDESKISLKEATEWSRKHGFEFIVLNPTIENDDNEEIIKEKVGVDRIIEALQTCIWPNLQMKEACTPGYNNLEKLSLHQNEEDLDKLIDEVLLDEGMDEFTELFGQLHTMKESIQSLSGSERKQCAEQMVTAFWKAIGGDDDELQDL